MKPSVFKFPITLCLSVSAMFLICSCGDSEADKQRAEIEALAREHRNYSDRYNSKSASIERDAELASKVIDGDVSGALRDVGRDAATRAQLAENERAIRGLQQGVTPKKSGGTAKWILILVVVVLVGLGVAGNQSKTNEVVSVGNVKINEPMAKEKSPDPPEE
jgi:hypothetical protein